MSWYKKLQDKYEIQSGLSPILYHHTLIPSAANILKENRFRLSSAVGTVERQHSGASHLYFLSTARVPYGDFRSDVIFVLDGTKLAQKYKGAPVDYWVGNKGDEAEDRILSDKPYIEDADKYIKEVHVLEQHDRARAAIKLAIEAKKLQIPIYFHWDKKSFIKLDKRHARTKPSHKPEPQLYRSGGQQQGRSLSKWIELYYNNDLSKLDDTTRRKLKHLGFKAVKIELEDTLRRSGEAVDNPQRQRLMQIWKKEGVTSVDGFLKFLGKKFAPMLKKEQDAVDKAEMEGEERGNLAKKAGRPSESVVDDMKKFLDKNTSSLSRERLRSLFFSAWYLAYFMYSDKDLEEFNALPPDKQRAIYDANSAKRDVLWEKVAKI